MVIFDGRKFNEKRYSLDNNQFCLLLEDYLDGNFVFSRTIGRAVYDDERREIFKSQKILDKVNIPNEIFDKMLKDESVALEKIDKTDIIDGSYGSSKNQLFFEPFQASTTSWWDTKTKQAIFHLLSFTTTMERR